VLACRTKAGEVLQDRLFQLEFGHPSLQAGIFILQLFQFLQLARWQACVEAVAVDLVHHDHQPQQAAHPWSSPTWQAAACYRARGVRAVRFGCVHVPPKRGPVPLYVRAHVRHSTIDAFPTRRWRAVRQRRLMATAPLHSDRQAREELDNRIAHRLGLFFLRDVAAPVQRQQFGVRNPALQFE